MNIFYWAIAFLKYDVNTYHLFDPDFFDANKIAAWVFIGAYIFYALIRTVFNQIAGLYMFKRLIIAAILAAGVYDKWQYVLLMLGLELVFAILRFILERPRAKL